MALFLSIILIIIRNIHGLSASCNESTGPCRIECIGEDSCKTTNIQCRPNYPCQIICSGKASCTDSIISANGSTDFYLTCSGEDACKSGLVSCGTNACQIDCISQNINNDVCSKIFVHVNHALSFVCTGECPLTVLQQTYTIPPTMHPTRLPTIQTNNPTQSPTNTSIPPTFNPTNFPTVIPTPNPTYMPTMLPTIDPTTEPTIEPTMEPTHNPTKSPSNIPSKSPTIAPTSQPTNEPTLNPSNVPTSRPTYNPSQIPSKSPSNNPSDIPTLSPTIFQTNNPSKSPTITPSDIPTVSPTILPSSNPTIQTTQTDINNGNCSSTPNITHIFSAPKDNQHTPNEPNSLISYGIILTISLNDKLNINDATHIITIVTEIMNTLIAIIRPNYCISSNALEIKSTHSTVSMSINLSIFVCNKQQQQQLRTLFDTNTNDMLCSIINSIQQQIGIVISLNSATLKTDTIEIQQSDNNNNNNMKTTQVYVSDNNNNNNNNNGGNVMDNNHTYYGIHGDDLQVILLIIVGTLAIAAVLIACAIFILGSHKMKRKYDAQHKKKKQKRKYMNRNTISTNTTMNTSIEMGKIKKNKRLLKKLSETIEFEVESSSSDCSDETCEVNLERVMSNKTDVNANATQRSSYLAAIVMDNCKTVSTNIFSDKCQCICHETEILATNDVILREICDPEQYDDAFGSPPHSPPHSIHECGSEISEQKQCCVIQGALWRAQIKKNFNENQHEYLINNQIVLTQNEAIGNDESPPDSSKTYELPKHAIV